MRTALVLAVIVAACAPSPRILSANGNDVSVIFDTLTTGEQVASDTANIYCQNRGLQAQLQDRSTGAGTTTLDYRCVAEER